MVPDSSGTSNDESQRSMKVVGWYQCRDGVMTEPKLSVAREWELCNDPSERADISILAFVNSVLTYISSFIKFHSLEEIVWRLRHQCCCV